MLGVQPLRYESKSNSVLATGKPLLAIVSPKGGTVSYEFLALSADGDPALLRFSKTGRTEHGYQRTDAGLIALATTTNRLLLSLHYIANLTPPGGHCRVGQTTPCRKIVTTQTANETDRDFSTAGFDSIELNSALISHQNQKKHSYALRYDPARFAFLQFNRRGVEKIEALSPALTDTFLATLPSAPKT